MPIKRRSTSAEAAAPTSPSKVVPKALTRVRFKPAAPVVTPKPPVRVRFKPVATKPTVSAPAKYKVLAIADARAKLAEIFDFVTSQQARAIVHAGDPKKTKFLTFDYKDRYMVEPILDISINQLKSNFSTFSSFVRLGMCFRVSRRTSNHPVFMRRFTHYTDPLDDIMTDYIERRARKAVEDALTDPSDALMADYIERRTRKAVEEALNARSESGIEKALLAIRHAHENDAADMMKEIKKISTGIGRMAVNRHPFNDVPLRKDAIIVGDGDD